ncbi:polysaccharide deacetylase family protein [Sphingobacterium sp. HJSM2_6]|uniref:polysaccharide deacetylase family protein n=1 Tax=Sphingobacterium sp. HJSM2_6 TaxID=3366264 RepID=UPI003BCEE844
MDILKNTFIAGICLFISITFLSSCNPFVGSATQIFGSDSSKNDQLNSEKKLVKDTTKLMDLLDSLNKNKIQFPAVDSLNTVEPRVAKRLLRDSIYRELNKKDKHIYLTFDDGPLIGSSAIDSIISAKNIKINAFLVGKHANMSKRLKRDFLRYKENPLVECYNHSYTHAGNRFHAFYSNPELVLADFEKCETDLELTHRIVRLPGRNIWLFDDVRRVDLSSGSHAADLLGVNGFKIYGWDVEWKINGLTGNPVQSVNEVYQRIQNMLSNKSTLKANNVVLLMHDDMFQNKKGQALLTGLIDSLKQHQDYKFEFISQYPIKY